MHDVVVITGSFNPPHICHFNLAFKTLEKYTNIKEAIFVPVGDKYVKADLQDSEYRFNMLKAYCETDTRLSVSRIEIDNYRQHYTYETLRIIQSEYPESRIYLVIGSDNLYQFTTWIKYEEILEEYAIIVFARDNSDLQGYVMNNNDLSKYSSSFSYIHDDSCYGTNSTVIRKLLKEKADASALLPVQVHEYIMKDNRYL